MRTVCHALTSFLFFCSINLQAGVLVVVNPDSPINNISPVQAANIFLGKTRNMPNGKLAIPVDQARNSSIRNEFYEKLVNKNQNQLNAYWARQVFTGKSQPPVQVNNDEEVKLLISTNPNMVGYINSEAIDDRVKVILRIP